MADFCIVWPKCATLDGGLQQSQTGVTNVQTLVTWNHCLKNPNQCWGLTWRLKLVWHNGMEWIPFWILNEPIFHEHNYIHIFDCMKIEEMSRDVITNKMLKSRKIWPVLQFIFAYSKKIRLSVKCMPKLEIVFGFSDTTTLIICTQNSC